MHIKVCLFIIFIILGCKGKSDNDLNTISSRVASIIKSEAGDKKVFLFSSRDCVSCLSGFEKFLNLEKEKAKPNQRVNAIFFNLTEYHNDKFDSLIVNTPYVNWYISNDSELIDAIESKMGVTFKPSVILFENNNVNKIKNIYINE